MDTVPMTNCCPKCGGPLAADAPQGLCAKCLLAAVSTATEPGSPAENRPAPPTLAAVAAAFPQLEIVELLGQGGMGVVYKARQPKLERYVALKLLPHGPGTDPAFPERFNREARLLARLNHPSIVTVYDFGQAGEFFFLMMEFVDGVNLRQAMQAARFTPAQALALVPRICEALQFAHDEGILHRDIKPENILLDTRGRVKIADFGIAKLMGDTLPERKLTESGAAIGTPHYMAPEQLEKPQDVDQRADVYSLGVVFYELLTGELPIGRFAPPSEKSAVDPRVDQVVFQALEKEREKRIGSAQEVKTRVETISQGALWPAAGAEGGERLARFNPSVKPIVMLGLIVALVGLIINTGGPAGHMVGSLVSLATSSASGALVAALAAAGFGCLIWLTHQCHNRILTPLGLGPVSEIELRAGDGPAAKDLGLHKVATVVLMTLAVFIGTRLVIHLVAMLEWVLGRGWIGYASLALGVLALFLTRTVWQPRLSAVLPPMMDTAERAAAAGSPATGQASVPPLLASKGSKPVWPLLGVLLILPVIVLLMVFSFAFHRHSRPEPFHKASVRPSTPESVLRTLPVAERNRLPGLTMFQWKCSVPASHVLLFRLVYWSSNGVPTVLENLSSCVVAPAEKPAEATFQWSVQDGARLSPELQGQDRWDRSLMSGPSRVDGAPLWMPKENPGWVWMTQSLGSKVRLRPGETTSLPMLNRPGSGIELRAIEAQVTLEPLGEGVPAGKSARLVLGTNWVDGAERKTSPVAENP